MPLSCRRTVVKWREKLVSLTYVVIIWNKKYSWILNLTDIFLYKKLPLNLYFFILSVACYPWHDILDSSTCIEDLLIINEWSTAEELETIAEPDRKTLLMLKISKKLNSTVHTVVDMSQRYSIFILNLNWSPQPLSIKIT